MDDTEQHGWKPTEASGKTAVLSGLWIESKDCLALDKERFVSEL